MRIAYLSADYGIPVLGGKGGSVHIQSLVRAFAQAGHEVTVYCARLGDGDPAALPARLVEVAKPAEVGDGRQPVDTGSGPVSERLTKERGWMARASAMEQCVQADHAREPFDMIYERYSLWSRAGVRIAQQTGLVCIAEVNAPLVEEAEAYRELAAKAEAVAIERAVLGKAHGVIAVSNSVAHYVRSKGAAAQRVHVIENGVDVAAFAPPARGAMTSALSDRIREGAITIGFVGGLKPWHGVQELLRAFRNITAVRDDVDLAIIGDGPMRAWIDGFADGTGLADRIHVTGWVAHTDLPGLLNAVDIATAPYPPIEGFYFSPLKLFEYLAAGRAIVASRIGQIDGIIRDGDNGLLVRPGDVTDLTRALAGLVADADRRGSLGARARASADAYSWSGVAERICAVAAAARAERWRHQVSAEAAQ